MSHLVPDVPGMLRQIGTVPGPGADPDLASLVTLSLDDSPAARALATATARLAGPSRAGPLIDLVLEEAMALSGTELGSLQIAESGASLRLVAQCGFGRDFADYFAVVADDASACGRAVSNGAQTVIPDVTVDAEFAPHRAVAAESGFRAVQSTPLVDVHGLLVGMVSTHFVRPGPLPDRTTRLLRLYGRYAAEAMRRALPDTPTAPAPAPPEERPAPSPRSGLSEADSRVLDLFDDVVRSLFAAGLNLAAAQSLVGGDAGSEVAEAIDRLDHALGGVRTAVLALHD